MMGQGTRAGPLEPHRVWVARAPARAYGAPAGEPAPELPGGRAGSVALVTLRALMRQAGLDEAGWGTPEWNPLGDAIRPGMRVLVKPNWVTHHNHSGAGLDPLVTHTSVVEAILLYAIRARPAVLTVGDAPIQGCDFGALRAAAGIDAMLERLRPEAERFGVRLVLADFRLTILPGGALQNRTRAEGRGDDDYVLFDLGTRSSLDPITDGSGRFRVTMYDPEALRRTHAPGRHQYLVAREAIEADVVINAPKLKCHKKACVTGALKNLVGINGHKEYLPHHRKGGARTGGDCYEGGSRLKGWVEEMYDLVNRTASPRLHYLLPRAIWLGLRVGVLLGEDGNVEGSWHGNDTVWRMCLDLQRVLRYGRADGTLAGVPQRQVISITDAIVAGEGEGPLAPAAAPLGVLTLAANPAAAEWVHALLMGFDPRRVPLIRNAFGAGALPLAGFAPEAVIATVDGVQTDEDGLAHLHPGGFLPPRGWEGHCEWAPRHAVGAP